MVPWAKSMLDETNEIIYSWNKLYKIAFEQPKW